MRIIAMSDHNDPTDTTLGAMSAEKRLKATSDTLLRFTQDYLNFRRMGFVARVLWLFTGRLL
jgi:hypothetical protein